MIYFYLMPPGDETHARYKPQLVALAEGLTSLGMDFGANIDYYRYTPGGPPLFKRCDPKIVKALILGSESLNNHECVALMRRCNGSRIPVVVFDWIASDLLLRSFPALSKANVVYWYAKNMRLPQAKKLLSLSLRCWPIGYTNRVQQMATTFATPFEQRADAVLWSHRLEHQVRGDVWKRWYLKFSSESQYKVQTFNDGFQTETNAEAKLMWKQTGRRHNPKFYRALGAVKIVDCCGGFHDGPGLYRQHDSYKIWEAWVMGCCVIALDYEYYGFDMPVMPKAGIDYIAIRPDDQAFTDRVFGELQSNKINVAAIAASGQKFALENYGPISCAKEVMNLI